SELLSLATDPHDVEGILDQLVRARLIHTETDATVELVHEMLIIEWPSLRRWLDDGHAMRAFIHEIRQAANQWHARGRPDDLVWRGATAQEAIGHARRRHLDLSATERDFLAAIEAQLARGRRRRAFVLAAIVGALALVLGGGAVAVVRIKLAESEAQDKAQLAESARQTAVDLARQLRAKVDELVDEKKRREAADEERLAEQTKRELAEQERQRSHEQLRETVTEAAAVKRRAEAERRRANQKTQE